VNLYDVETSRDDDGAPGYESRYARLGPALGASALGMSVYDLDPGNSICPYHWEDPEEEWLFVLAGRPTLRDPDGEHELEAGDVVCFPSGPEGVHKVTNRSREPVRVAMLSTKTPVAYAVYPDGGKVGVFPLGKFFRLADEVDYFEGEL
jgi:uncharacterized cupin superfamily protein